MTTNQRIAASTLSEMDEFRQIMARAYAKRDEARTADPDEIQEKFDIETAPLRRVVEVARGHSGQSIRAASFLLSLYDGERFPLDLRDLRIVDEQIFNDCVAIIQLDHGYQMNVARFFKNGDDLFEQIAIRQRMPDVLKAKRQSSPQ
jgi:hypothetical protein